MNIIPSIFLAFSESLDSLIIVIAYVVKKIRIGLFINIVIALIVNCGTFISMVLGSVLNKFIPIIICNYVGAILLLIVGLYMIVEYLKKSKSLKQDNSKTTNDIMESLDYDEIMIQNKTSDADGSGNIELREAVTLALALSVNNFALGLGASMSGISIPLTTIFTFVFSIVILIIGLKLGNSILSKVLGKYSPLFSALIILIMGIVQLF